MLELIKMIVVLTVISLPSGGLLAALRDGTQERIDNQVLEFVKGPAVRQVFEGVSNDPIASRFQLKDGDQQRSFFVGVFDGEPKGLESDSSGFSLKRNLQDRRHNKTSTGLFCSSLW